MHTILPGTGTGANSFTSDSGYNSSAETWCAIDRSDSPPARNSSIVVGRSGCALFRSTTNCSFCAEISLPMCVTPLCVKVTSFIEIPHQRFPMDVYQRLLLTGLETLAALPQNWLHTEIRNPFNSQDHQYNLSREQG